MRRFHQLPADRAILRRRIDCDRPQPCDDIAFVEKIAPDDPSIDLRHDRVKLRMREHPRQQPDSHFGRRKIGRKIMCFGNVLERLVTNGAARDCIVGRAGTQLKIHSHRYTSVMAPGKYF